MNLKNSFSEYCKINKFEINKDQLSIIDHLNIYFKKNFKQSIFSNLFKKKETQIGFYLVGDIGVGKTMILNFFFEKLKVKKLRLHFNEFMINFHDFIFKNKNLNKENGINNFVRDLSKKTKILYFDEFQVTNIVDAMILGKLFEKIFEENIKVIFSSNIKIDDLYKDGLQREQFLPFLKIIKEKIYEYELKGDVDFRKQDVTKINRFFYPNDKKALSNINQLFRKLTKDRKKLQKEIIIRGRKFPLEQFYDGVARFDFKELCDQNLGAEDYIEIAKFCKFIIIENIPNFNESISNQQQRFITLIDVFYENRIKLMVSSKNSLEDISSASALEFIFKRTKSRLYELTSPMVT